MYNFLLSVKVFEQCESAVQRASAWGEASQIDTSIVQSVMRHGTRPEGGKGKRSLRDGGVAEEPGTPSFCATIIWCASRISRVLGFVSAMVLSM